MRYNLGRRIFYIWHEYTGMIEDGRNELCTLFGFGYSNGPYTQALIIMDRSRENHGSKGVSPARVFGI
jgi:hypothetical protein